MLSHHNHSFNCTITKEISNKWVNKKKENMDKHNHFCKGTHYHVSWTVWSFCSTKTLSGLKISLRFYSHVSLFHSLDDRNETENGSWYCKHFFFAIYRSLTRRHCYTGINAVSGCYCNAHFHFNGDSVIGISWHTAYAGGIAGQCMLQWMSERGLWLCMIGLRAW